MSFFAQSPSALAPATFSGGGKRGKAASIEILSLTPAGDIPNGKGMRSTTVMIVAPFRKQESFDVVPGAGAELVGPDLVFDLQEIDVADKEAKKGSMQRANRHPVEEKCVLTLGSVFELAQHKMAPVLPHRIYKVNLSAADLDDYKGVKVMRFAVEGAITHLRPYHQMSPSEQNWALLAQQAAGLVSTPLVHAVYTPETAARVKNMSEEQRKDWNKEKKKEMSHIFTPPTCAMKRNPLVFSRHHGVGPGEDYLANALIQRGKRANFLKEPALPMSTDDAWPRIKAGEGGAASTAIEFMKFSIEGEQFIPKKGATPPLPITDKHTIPMAYDYNKFRVDVLVSSSTLQGYGVVDDRHQFGVELRALVYATPSLYRCWLSGNDAEVVEPAPDVDVRLSVATSGTKLEKGKPADTTGVLPDIPVGVVNAGYPVSRDAAMELLSVLHTREPGRYATNMSTVGDMMDAQGIARLPENTLNTATGTRRIYNLLEAALNIETLPETDWTFFVIPNRAIKSVDPPVDGKPAVESLGYQYYRKQVEELGEEGASKSMGELFVALASGKLQALGKLTQEAQDAFYVNGLTFNFLMFAIRNNYIAQRGLTPLSCVNHVGIMNGLAHELYPDDLSDIAEMKRVHPWFYTYAFQRKQKRKSDGDDEPEEKKQACSSEPSEQDGSNVDPPPSDTKMDDPPTVTDDDLASLALP